MYTLKSIVQRGTLFGATAALVAAAIIPAASVFADSLNPLTERSLRLSSSAPGWQDTDGSGNSYDSPNSGHNNGTVIEGTDNIPRTYAPAGSGPNGRKSGEVFTFKVSSSATVKGFSLQYCTSAAGWCQAPGNNAGDARDDSRETNEVGRQKTGNTKTSDLDFEGAFADANGVSNVPGTFEVRVKGSKSDGVITGGTSDSGWTFAKDTLEDDEVDQLDPLKASTGKNNYVTLTKEAGVALEAGDIVQIIFTPSETVHITNPGADAFFVKINTYNSNTSLVGSHNDTTRTDNTDTPDHTVIDGGVTVANVMTDSIHITTKVLETMAFSVGTKNRDTLALSHGSCDPIEKIDNNRLNLGNSDAEFSLETDEAYDVFSYWRLSSNSSGGATVYYSGNTLTNTVGDQIDEIGETKQESHPGTEQFGLAVIDAGEDTLDGGTFPSNHIAPNIAPLVTRENYNEGGAQNDNNISNSSGNAKFAFQSSSSQTPVIIAQNSNTVISCATAKMRYVANIAADTPAGIYTTKINYLAAPQY